VGLATRRALAVCVALTASTLDARAQTASAAPRGAEADAFDPRIAFVDVQRVAIESETGKALAGRVEAISQQRTGELNEKRKALRAVQEKLDTAASVLNPGALAQLQREIERQQIDIQRFTEDAQADLQNLQVQLEGEFEAQLTPVLHDVAVERGLHLLFSAADSGLVWAAPSTLPPARQALWAGRASAQRADARYGS